MIIGLFIGGLLPFIFTAFSMDAVGKAAGAVVREVRRQITAKPGILTRRGHARLRHLRRHRDQGGAARDDRPGAAAGRVRRCWSRRFQPLGPVVLGGVLVGTIVTGFSWRIAMTSSGGAWDNAKKYIEEGNHGGKGSLGARGRVTGDTVGDPYKDTAVRRSIR